MNIPRPSSRLQYLVVAVLGLLVLSGGFHLMSESPSERVGTEEPNNWTPSNEPIVQTTDTPSPPPNARDHLNSENGTIAVQLSNGVTIIKGYQYEYTISRASGSNGTVHFKTRDTNPGGHVILGVEYKFEQDSNMTSNTAVGDSVRTLLDDVENGTARIALAEALSLPYLNNTTIRPSANVGDTWSASGGVTAEAVRRDTVGGIKCLHIKFTKNGEVLSEVCYSPDKQIVAQRITYENGVEIRRVTLSATR